MQHILKFAVCCRLLVAVLQVAQPQHTLPSGRSRRNNPACTLGTFGSSNVKEGVAHAIFLGLYNLPPDISLTACSVCYLFWCGCLLVLLSLQVLAADHIGVMEQCMLLLLDLRIDSAAAASAVARPLLQLLGPAVKYCLQQLQQQQQQQGAASPDGVQALPPNTS
jgi:hypothetical protein